MKQIKAATSRENGKNGGRPRGVNLSTLIDTSPN